MDALYQYILWIHAGAGFVGLALFWAPIALRKGSPNHKRIGNYYLKAMGLAGYLGVIMALMILSDPVSIGMLDANSEQSQALVEQASERGYFFLLLAFLLIATVQRSKLCLKAGADRRLLRRPRNLIAPILLVAAGLWLTWIAFETRSALYGSFAGIGLFIAIKLLWYAFKPSLKRPEWIIEHLGAAIGSGVAAHTAFFVFGAASIMGELFRGQMVLVPWTVPSLVGGTAIIWLSRKYRRRFGIGSPYLKARSSTPKTRAIS